MNCYLFVLPYILLYTYTLKHLYGYMPIRLHAYTFIFISFILSQTYTLI